MEAQGSGKVAKWPTGKVVKWQTNVKYPDWKQHFLTPGLFKATAKFIYNLLHIFLPSVLTPNKFWNDRLMTYRS